MSNIKNAKITELGAALIAKSQLGGPISFTRLVLGDGFMASDQTTDTMTSIVNPKAVASMIAVKLDDKTVRITGIFSSQSLSEGFYYREVGLFALDPEVGEILVCYGNAEDEAEWIPPSDEIYIKERVLELGLVVGNATNITAVINTNMTFVTHPEHNADVSRLEERINNLPKPVFYCYSPKTPDTPREEAIDEYIQTMSLSFMQFYKHPTGFVVPFKANIIVRALVDCAGYGTNGSNEWNGMNLRMTVDGSTSGQILKYKRIEVKRANFNAGSGNTGQSVRSTLAVEALISNHPANVPITPELAISKIHNDCGEAARVYGYTLMIEAHPA